MPGFPRGPPLCSRGRHSCPDPFVSTVTDAQRTWDGGKESKIQATNRVIPSVPLLFQDSLWLACERNIPDAGKGRPPCGWHGWGAFYRAFSHDVTDFVGNLSRHVGVPYFSRWRQIT